MSEAVGEKTGKGTGDSAGQGRDAAANGAAISVLHLLGSAANQHETGELEEAEKGYRTVLTVEPENTDALQLLGVLRHQQGDSNEAIRLIKKALKRDPDSPQCHHNLASVFNSLGRVDEAEKHFRKAVALDPNEAKYHANLGIVMGQKGREEEAIECFEKALRADPEWPAANRELGGILLRRQHYEKAERCLRAYLECGDEDPIVTSNLGFVLQKMGRLDEAEEMYLKATELETGSAELHHNIRNIMIQQGRSEEARELLRQQLRNHPEQWVSEARLAFIIAERGWFDEAMEVLREILDVNSENAEVWNDIGALLLGIRKYSEAEEILSHAIELDPRMAEAANNLGNMYLITNRPELGMHHCKNALLAKPDFLEPLLNLSKAYRQMSQFDQACLYARAVLDHPNYSPRYFPGLSQVFRTLCDFENLAALGDVWDNCEDHVATEDLPALFLGLLAYAGDEDQVWRFHHLVRKWAESIEKQAAAAPLPTREKRKSASKLRIGILSSDLYTHSVSRFLVPWIRDYDRERFEIYCYTPIRSLGDARQQFFMEKVDEFTFVDNRSDREIAENIQEDGVDILLELNGFTRNTRLPAVAYKPAPVQMSWLGYPFTCGLKAIDYVIMDRFVKPAVEDFLVEEPLVMPEGWVCFGEFDDVEIAQGIPADRNGRITFGTLNNPYKFSQEMIALWAKVMNRVPDSRLLVVRSHAGSLTFCKNLADEFTKHGVSADRLYLFDNSQENTNHLTYYNDIDISLDTFPLTGGTTTCEATWMGVPVVTLVGESFHQRISYSDLMHCGLEELCTFTPEDYVEKAVALAGDRDKLLAWRHGLRGVMRQSPLCDEERFLFQFQDMLEHVAELHGLR
ncbi:MAG: tetratricopeptide repeat protein [Proteobacteria bacterium]|nr:tetratricopeptide repeat protein [Pseudomonadota bacterium]